GWGGRVGPRGRRVLERAGRRRPFERQAIVVGVVDLRGERDAATSCDRRLVCRQLDCPWTVAGHVRGRRSDHWRRRKACATAGRERRACGDEKSAFQHVQKPNGTLLFSARPPGVTSCCRSSMTSRVEQRADFRETGLIV